METIPFWEKIRRKGVFEKKFICFNLNTDLHIFGLKSFDFLPVIDGEEDAYRQYRYFREVVEATYTRVAAYRVNVPVFEQYGSIGYGYLRSLVRYIKEKAHEMGKHIPTIADAKLSGTGCLVMAYASRFFDDLGFDAVTVTPYLGMKALGQILRREQHGVLVSCRTANEGADAIQDLYLSGGIRLYESVASQVERYWNANDNCGLILSLLRIEDLRLIRSHIKKIPLLVGVHGAKLPEVVQVARNDEGGGFLINDSTAAIGEPVRDFADRMRAKLGDMNQIIAHGM